MLRSKFTNHFMFPLPVVSLLFVLVGVTIKFITTDDISTWEYCWLSFLMFSGETVLLLMLRNLFKRVEVGKDYISVKQWFGAGQVIRKGDVEGFWDYKTIGAFGDEDSVYIRLKNGRKIGIHKKAYKNFAHIRSAIIRLGLRNLGGYDYHTTRLKYLGILLPILFILSFMGLVLVKLFT